ncbi:MAG: hypothetical protein E5X48_00215 [Mesorhizobium sp.]|uniref:hypothetical protein n=1 Tax=Mesorhizobium sp. TaxID=1871066 RepID=UPI00121A1231|nr:hypothetical protein [Mesorhizobium sp.]TIQ38343.1 MAG: hypothetical protein E5X48_00215 [Mesorhizobium sp.]
MRKIKNLKRVERVRRIATRFRSEQERPLPQALCRSLRTQALASMVDQQALMEIKGQPSDWHYLACEFG